MTQPTLEKAVSYSRKAYSIANGAGTEVSRIVDAQIAETNKKVAQLIDFAAKNRRQDRRLACRCLRAPSPPPTRHMTRLPVQAAKPLQWQSRMCLPLRRPH